VGGRFPRLCQMVLFAGSSVKHRTLLLLKGCKGGLSCTLRPYVCLIAASVQARKPSELGALASELDAFEWLKG
jgi:hypothetical protein